MVGDEGRGEERAFSTGLVREVGVERFGVPADPFGGGLLAEARRVVEDAARRFLADLHAFAQRLGRLDRNDVR